MPTAEDFARHFADLTDSALLAVRPSELVETAVACWQAEIAKRGLVLPSEQTAADGDAAGAAQPQGAEFVPLAEFEEPGEAILVQSKLSAVQIPALFLSDRGPVWEPKRIFGQTNFVLVVPSEMHELALEAMEAELSDEDLEAQALAADVPDGADPQ